MSAIDLPRVLVVTSNNFNLVSGGGITLTNLFRGWPADRLANLHEDPTPEDRLVCANAYRLGGEEIRFAWPWSLGQAVRAVAPGAALAVPAGDGRRRRLLRGLFGDGVPRTVRLTPRLLAWLAAARPQLIYGFLGSMAQIRLVRAVAGTLGVPVALHIMDDWPAVVYRQGVLAPVLRRAVLREFRALLQAARLRLGISEEMCAEYQRRYGYAFRPFHNALDMEAWTRDAKRDWRGGSPFTIRYVGSILPDGQRTGLRDVWDAVARLRAAGAHLELAVHAPRGQTAYLAPGGTPPAGLVLAEPPPPEQIGRCLGEADLLVLPFNFDPRSARYVRLSMPTKIPAYMASGTPILVYGPADLATTRYAERGGWAHVVATRDAGALERALAWLVSDQPARQQLGQRAHALARERHDAARVRPAFWAALAAAANDPARWAAGVAGHPAGR